MKKSQRLDSGGQGCHLRACLFQTDQKGRKMDTVVDSFMHKLSEAMRYARHKKETLSTV